MTDSLHVDAVAVFDLTFFLAIQVRTLIGMHGHIESFILD